jgi:hypothetical protein
MDRGRWPSNAGVATGLVVALGLVVWAAGTVSAGEPGRARPAAVAGTFYPGDPEVLERQVDGLLSAATSSSKRSAMAVIVPHAGYVYSGRVAAEAIAALPAEGVRRVLLLGPSHRMDFAGGALPAARIDRFQTPIGAVPLDTDALAELRDGSELGGPYRAHDHEHALEVELPLLLRQLGPAPLVPVLVGPRTDREGAMALAEQVAGVIEPGTVVVVSSDFTHHGAAYRWAPFPRGGLPERLLELGRATAGRAAAMDAGGFWHQVMVSGDTVCGARPIQVLLELLKRRFDGSGEVLEVTTSGSVSGSWEQSVTYAAVAYRGQWRSAPVSDSPPPFAKLSAADGKRLLGLARSTLRSHTGHGPELAHWFEATTLDDRLRARACAFVTLRHSGGRRDGELRACMGSLTGCEPLVDSVVQAAVSAAHDPRFRELQARELDDLELEVSVLTPMRRVPGPQLIELGKHGVVLSKGGRSAVYLPQVATETGWDLETFLSRLAKKAGLPANAWRSGAQLEVFEALVFHEDETAGRGGAA